MKSLYKKMNIELMIVALAFVFYFLWSVTLPFNTGPDEYMRYQIPQFILEHGFLPHGGDPRIRNEIWGISYGFTPILSYIISAIFMWIVRFINHSDFALLTAARFVSVLCSTGTIFMCIKIGKKLFKDYYQYLFAVLVAFLPQFVFISSYVNNDAIAILSTSIIIYFWIIGLETKWTLISCVGLAVGISLCGLSYYNAYGYILCSILLFLVSVLYMNKDKGIKKYKILIQKGGLISGIVVILIAWWFIRSYIIYDGDLLGMSTTYKYSEMFALDQFKPSNRQTPIRQGISVSYMIFTMGWFKLSWKSFIGMFDYMSVHLYDWMYYLYNIFSIVGISGLLLKSGSSILKKERYLKKHVLIYFSMFISSIITVLLSVYYSYTSDYQPQGRYSMPIIIPFMLFMTIGLKYLLQNINKSRDTESKIVYCVIIGYILVAFITYSNIIIPAYYL